MSKKRKSFNIKTREKDQSRRQLKVSQLINISLIECLKKDGGIDSRLYGFPINITKVNITADLKIANCFFVPFNTNLTSDDILDAFEASKYAIRAYITRNVHLKFSPEIRFYYDEAFENLNRIEQLLKL